MSATDTPLLARLMTSASRSRMPSSDATSASWTAARMAGTSGVTGTRMRSAFSKIAWLSVLYDGCRSTTTKSKPRRAASIASATRFGSRISVCSGDEVSATTRSPDGWADGDVGERLDRAALELVAPAVDDRAHVLDAERRRDVAGHGVGVDEQDALALADLERGGEVRRDGRLADAALRVEHGDDGRAAGPAVGGHVAALEDRARAVVDGLAADAHRLDAPAQRLGGVGPGEVLVLDAAGAVGSAASWSSVRGETTMSAGIARPPSRSSP